jgi:ribosome maturation factor RimP
MIDKERVKEIVDDFLKSSDNYLVDIEVKPDNTIMVEIDNDCVVSIDDCVALSKHIESRLDRDEEDYALEVGSAGIGQAFKIQRQYRKNIGNTIEVLAKSGVKHTGVLKDVDEKGIVLTVLKQIKPEGAKRKVTVEEDITFLYEEMKYAKYFFSDK